MTTIDPSTAAPTDAPAPTDLAASVAASWWLLLALGVLTIAAGIGVLAWPGLTLLVLAVLFGVWLLTSGAVRVLGAIADKGLPPAMRIAEGLIGALLVAAGIACVTNLVKSLTTLVLLMGVLFVVDGVGDVVAAIADHSGRQRMWLGVTRVLGIAAGLIVVSRPDIALATLVALVGALLVLVGVARIAAAFAIRRLSAA